MIFRAVVIPPSAEVVAKQAAQRGIGVTQHRRAAVDAQFLDPCKKSSKHAALCVVGRTPCEKEPARREPVQRPLVDEPRRHELQVDPRRFADGAQFPVVVRRAHREFREGGVFFPSISVKAKEPPRPPCPLRHPLQRFMSKNAIAQPPQIPPLKMSSDLGIAHGDPARLRSFFKHHRGQFPRDDLVLFEQRGEQLEHRVEQAGRHRVGKTLPLFCVEGGGRLRGVTDVGDVTGESPTFVVGQLGGVKVIGRCGQAGVAILTSIASRPHKLVL